MTDEISGIEIDKTALQEEGEGMALTSEEAAGGATGGEAAEAVVLVGEWVEGEGFSDETTEATEGAVVEAVLVTDGTGDEGAPNLPYDLSGACEAMLFVSDEPLGLSVFASMLQARPAEVQQALEALQARYAEQSSGFVLREVAGGWRLFTNPVYHDLIESYVLSWDTRKLSAAALETLAVVAYAQPVTRNGVASVRGVSSDSALHSLIEKGLVKEVGVAETPGNPTLYGTTRGFLEKFGLRTPKDLPDLAQYAPDLETERLIRERLSASREEGYSIADEVRLGYQPVDGADGEPSPQDAILSALASSLGVVDKIDFDALVFETDDE